MKKCQECNETRNAEELYDTKICEKCEHSDEFYKLNKKKPHTIRTPKKRFEPHYDDFSFLQTSNDDDDYEPH
jgi:hypothetical protein